MAETILSISMDEMLKNKFEALCNDFGMSASTAMNVFAKAVVRERKIPFDIKSSDITREDGLKAFYALREEAKRNGLQDMTLEEINAEITAARNER